MEHVIESFFESAAKANDWKCFLDYLWAETAHPEQDFGLIDDLMKMKAKGA